MGIGHSQEPLQDAQPPEIAHVVSGQRHPYGLYILVVEWLRLFAPNILWMPVLIEELYTSLGEFHCEPHLFVQQRLGVLFAEESDKSALVQSWHTRKKKFQHKLGPSPDISILWTG